MANLTNITKHDYFMLGMRNKWYKDAYWVKNIFSLVIYPNPDKDYLLRYDENTKKHYFINEGIPVYLTDYTNNKVPLFRVGEMVTLPNGTLPNQTKDITTSYGCLFQNYLLIIDVFQNRLPYINRTFTPNDVVKLYLPLWERSRYELEQTGEEPKPNEVFTEDHLAFADNCLHLTNYTQTVIPCVTEKAMCSNPELDKRKKELYEEYKDRLDDPTVQAFIDDELVKVDKAWLKGDESMGFLISGKAWNNTRKRLNSHFGSASNLDDAPNEFITRPLREGIDIYNMSAYVNDAYSGSIGRGLETQEGGVEVKNALRSAGNLKVGEDDCGSKLGTVVKLTDKLEDNYRYLGYWYIDGKETKVINHDNLPSLLGTEVLMRAPAFCQSKNSSFCRKCAGPNISNYENGIASVNAIPGSRIMNAKMKKMHTSVKSNATWRISLIS